MRRSRHALRLQSQRQRSQGLYGHLDREGRLCTLTAQENNMAKGDAFWRVERQKDALRQAEAGGQVADSLDVRQALMGRVHKGEITLAAAQAELKKIRRGAKAAGKVTRSQAFRQG
jgi:hypothetical protein